MRVYLDDDCDSKELLRRLRHRGHSVLSPREIGRRSSSDLSHLLYATEQGYLVLTKNAKDFQRLDRDWTDGRPHAGILLIFKDDNARRDITFAEIVTAIDNLERSGVPLGGQCHNLNQWR